MHVSMPGVLLPMWAMISQCPRIPEKAPRRDEDSKEPMKEEKQDSI